MKYQEILVFPPKKLIFQKQVSRRQRTLIPIDLNDISSFERDTTLCHKIENNTLRYVAMCSDVVDQLLPTTSVNLEMSLDTQDIMNEQRRQQIQQREEQLRNADPDIEGEDTVGIELPKALTRR